MHYNLAFDIGSRVMKCAIGDDAGTVIHLDQAKPVVTCSDDGFCRACNEHAYWDDIVRLAKKTIAGAGIEPGRIKYITASSIRPSCVFTDDDYDPLYIGTSFDMRGIDVADALEAELASRGSRSFFDITGHFPLLMYPPARYAWFKENEGNTCKRASRYLPVDSWILIKLGAEEHANPASAAESGFYDIKEKSWHEQWLDILDVREDFFPPVVDSGEIVGDLSPAVGRELGLGADVAIVSGMPDTQAALVGAGCIAEANAGIVIGSTMPVQMLSRECILDKTQHLWTTLLSMKHVATTHVLEASAGITGQILRWTASMFHGDGTGKPEDLFKRLDADLEAIDVQENDARASNDEVIAFLGPNYLASSDNTIHPGIIIVPSPGTVDEVHTSRAQVVGAVFDNISFAAYKNLKHLTRLLGREASATCMLGGVTRNKVFCQRFADLLDATITITTQPEATVTGLFDACAVASNQVTSASDLAHRIESRNGIEKRVPRERMRDVLQARFQRWDAFREKISHL